MVRSIYTDFDGTVTKRDTVNAFFERHADASWVESEKAWVAGRITSRENALVQVGLIRPMTEKTLNEYIDSIEIDERFPDFYRYAVGHGFKVTILSDGFDLFIERTLAKHGLGDIPFYANHLVFRDNRFAIEFPHFTASCRNGAGMCKCSKIAGGGYFYAGDGVTDLCVAKNADVLFASKYLKEYCNDKGIRHVPFDDFGDILDYLVKLQAAERSETKCRR